MGDESKSLERITLRGYTHVFVLEVLGDTEEESGCFLGVERLSSIQKEDDPCQERTTSTRRDGRLVEYPSFLYDGCFVVVER
jgi:hypothetical protein